MHQGTIKTVLSRGYGFITREETSKDIFFHLTQVKNRQFNDLRGGEKVEFEVRDGEKGLVAINIHVIS